MHKLLVQAQFSQILITAELAYTVDSQFNEIKGTLSYRTLNQKLQYILLEVLENLGLHQKVVKS